jgi:glycosyltransferase involved in cell wall biosynthesis
MSQPLFTVATITYNSSKWVRQAIESVLASSYTDFEYLISDDCSTDDTWEIIKEYNDPRIRSWRNDSNLGEYPNRNKVLYEAKGKYILYIDGDDILYKNTLRNLSEYIEYFPEAGMVWGIEDVYFPNVVYPYLFEPTDIIRFLYTIISSLPYTGFGETVFKTEVLLKNGGISGQFSMGDIYLRKKLSISEKTIFIPRGLVFWRYREDQASKKIEKNYLKLKEDLIIDRLIINDPSFPCDSNIKKVIARNIKIREVKQVFNHTLRHLNIRDFFLLNQELDISLSQYFLLFEKQKYNKYYDEPDMKYALMNDYNFKK